MRRAERGQQESTDNGVDPSPLLGDDAWEPLADQLVQFVVGAAKVFEDLRVSVSLSLCQRPYFRDRKVAAPLGIGSDGGRQMSADEWNRNENTHFPAVTWCQRWPTGTYFGADIGLTQRNQHKVGPSLNY